MISHYPEHSLQHCSRWTKSRHQTYPRTLEFVYVVITKEKLLTKIGFFNGIHVGQILRIDYVQDDVQTIHDLLNSPHKRFDCPLLRKLSFFAWTQLTPSPSVSMRFESIFPPRHNAYAIIDHLIRPL
jgi:hypothetical protein